MQFTCLRNTNQQYMTKSTQPCFTSSLYSFTLLKKHARHWDYTLVQCNSHAGLPRHESSQSHPLLSGATGWCKRPRAAVLLHSVGSSGGCRHRRCYCLRGSSGSFCHYRGNIRLSLMIFGFGLPLLLSCRISPEPPKGSGNTLQAGFQGFLFIRQFCFVCINSSSSSRSHRYLDLSRSVCL